MNEGPKLFTSKPKKARIKDSQQRQNQSVEVSSPPPPPPPSSSAAGGILGTQVSSSLPPPQPPKESFARRYKFLWPLLLTVNLTVGAYLLMRTKKKDTSQEEITDTAVVPSVTPPTTAAETAPITEDSLPPPPVQAPVKLIKPIPEDQQRELFKWILEEKRKVQPKTPEEKKRIDEEKAILKQFIRAKSIPSI